MTDQIPVNSMHIDVHHILISSLQQLTVAVLISAHYVEMVKTTTTTKTSLCVWKLSILIFTGSI